jgi:hypothetical protein
MLRVSILVLAAASCCAQALPQNWAGAGGAFTPATSPQAAGWASYATLISQTTQAYSFTSHDIFLSANLPHTVLSSVRTGIALVMRRAGPLTVLGLGDAGVAAGGTSAGGAYSGGGIGILQIGKTSWTLCAAVRVVKTTIGGTQNVYEFGLGRLF